MNEEGGDGGENKGKEEELETTRPQADEDVVLEKREREREGEREGAREEREKDERSSRNRAVIRGAQEDQFV